MCDPEVIAQILVEASISGDEATAKRNGITLRTIGRYRVRARHEPALSEIVLRKKELAEANWAAELPSAIRAGIDFMLDAFRSKKRDDPDMLHAVAGAWKILTEAALTKDVLDARLTGIGRPNGREAGQVVAAAAGGAGDS